MTEDERLKIVNDAVERLREHFDSVAIFATVYDSDERETHSFSQTGGNWFANLGKIRSWVIKQEAIEADDATKDDDDDDDGDEWKRA